MARSDVLARRGDLQGASAILQQGFRPFFLAAGLWALLAMLLWTASLHGMSWLPEAIAGSRWHANAMLFGYGSAAVAGFLLTAIPNWTGRLPLQGAPLAVLALIWGLGRLAVIFMDQVGVAAAGLIDAAFLIVFWGIIAREIVAGRNWRNVPVLGAVGTLALAHVLFWLGVAGWVPVGLGERLAIGVLTLLIALIGGRIVPSFTRNWLKKQGAHRFPAPADRGDRWVLVITAAGLLAWVAAPMHVITAVICGVAALGHVWRVSRWRGAATWREPLLLVLHVGYAWVPVGLALVAFAPVMTTVTGGLALHALTAGAIGTMTLAVMTRATLGHTGRDLTAGVGTSLIFVAIVLSALLRLGAPIWPSHYMPLLQVSAALWMVAFALFCACYGPLFLRPRQKR